MYCHKENLLQHETECFIDWIENYKPNVLFDYASIEHLACWELQVVKLKSDVEVKVSYEHYTQESLFDAPTLFLLETHSHYKPYSQLKWQISH